MIKLFLLNISLLFMLDGGNTFFSSNYIGMDKSIIEEKVKENTKTLRLNTSVTNTSFRYLKFEDKINEITVLFFLDERDKCTMVRLMSDYSNINDMLMELNTAYTPIDKKNWQYTDNDKQYIVNLEDGDWFYTITIKEKN